MIGFLSGTVEFFDQGCLVINVNGVGYKVSIANDVLSKLQIGENLKLHIHTHVREDSLDLYGFLELSDLRLFENLIGVSGVGPKTALSIFSTGSRNMIINAVINSDVSFFTSVPRLGKKNAQKIIIELKTKLGSTRDLDLSIVENKENNELVSALKSLGFSGQEINNVVKEIGCQEVSTEEKIKMALKYLSK